jgi:uncharacterized protein YbcI
MPEPKSKACRSYNNIAELLDVMGKAPGGKKCSFTVSTYIMILREITNRLSTAENVLDQKPNLDTVEQIRSSIENLSTSVQADDAEEYLF